MCKGKTPAQAGPVRPIEFKQAWRRLVAQSVRAALNQSFADPSGIEALTFQGQKRQLIERVHQAKGAG
jgi:1,6-anhydro-N-acetylmuramate kinase